ncbi:hypothetical protein V4F55_004997 [Vibrio parahaemolyticus]|uniref:Uncharacterized protein n=1 Tax=Vibrio parahaemolyticus TaxID=670 RepID=A0AA46UK71_VIBPH|nr:ABC-three component system middle component 8 [Vibrio parahaemolyticus]EGR1279216.1 hypothetical protein [Vibrio cholerae]HDV0904600.1 hypothetical protein [Vibrio fluvialis]EGR3365365.1 hypothetical protein [Vibrio parahaemolyticus]EHC9834988.1 hypothetical protein [Vibrio cholerae]EJK2411589.1 hypothetical protein [Vibrio parahaemolyticus]
MLVPNRFSNLKYSLLFTTSLLIEALNNNSGRASIQEVLCYMRETDSDYSRDDVLSAITFLFALGKLSYQSDTDVVKYIGEK